MAIKTSKTSKKKAQAAVVVDKDAFLREDGYEPENLDEVLKILEDRYAEWMMKRVGLISNDKVKKQVNQSSASLPKLRANRPSLDNLLSLAATKEKEIAEKKKKSGQSLPKSGQEDAEELKRLSGEKKDKKAEKKAKKKADKKAGLGSGSSDMTYPVGSPATAPVSGYLAAPSSGSEPQSITSGSWDGTYAHAHAHAPLVSAQSYGYSPAYLSQVVPAMPSIPEALELDNSHQLALAHAAAVSHTQAVEQSHEDLFASALDAWSADAASSAAHHGEGVDSPVNVINLESTNANAIYEAEKQAAYAHAAAAAAEHEAFQYYTAPAAPNAAYDMFMAYPYPAHTMQP